MQAESLRYILGLCTHAKNKQMKKHNEIYNLVTNNVFKDSTILRERGELRKPDLVIKDDDTIYVVDVTEHDTYA